MATIAPATAGSLDVVIDGDRRSAPCAADIVGGTFVRQDSSGNWVQALADTAPHALGARFAPRSAKAGEALTAFRTGVFGGFTISQAFNVNVYLSDTGTLADAAGTVSVIAGRVIPGCANQVTAAHDKLIELNLPE